MVSKPVFVATILTAVLVYTGLVPVYRTPQFLSVIPPESVSRLTGTVMSSPVRTSSGKSYRMEVSVTAVSGTDRFGYQLQSDASGTVMLFADAALIEALYPGRLYSRLGERNGDLIEQGAVITADVRFFSSDDTSGWYTRDVSVTSYTGRLSWVRALLRLQLKRIIYSWQEAGGLLLALVSGEREYLDTSLSDAFRNAGLSHILALSGMHLSLFASLARKVTQPAGGIRFSAFAGLFTAVLFVWFAGATPSLVRALICMNLGFLCSLLHLSASGPETLACAFLLQVALFPQHADDIAFLLSYGALAGVYAGSCYFTPVLLRFLPRSVASSAGASMGAFLCTVFISLRTFGTAMPGGIVASVVVTPVAELFVTGGIFALILCLIVPFLLVPVGSILGIPYQLLQFLVRFFARIPGISILEDTTT